MDALTWLARTSNFVSEKLAKEMIQAFGDTENPTENIDQRRRFMN